ncbi:unnamed protein product [Urochloa humidicola]
MHPRDLIGGLDVARQQATRAALSAVSLAGPAAGLAGSGLGFVKRHATTAMVSTGEGAAKAALSAVSLAKPAAGVAGSGLGFVKRHAAAMVSTRESAAKTAAMVVGSAVGAYFLWPAAAAPAAAGAMMKAPGAAGFLISRTAFAANPQLYFQILRTAGAAAAAAAFV